MIYLFGAVALLTIYCVGVFTADSGNRHMRFVHETAKTIFPIFLLAATGFVFRGQIYKMMIRGSVEIGEPSCSILNAQNYVWDCRFKLTNIYDGTVSNRVFEIRSSVKNHNFVKCLTSVNPKILEVKSEDKFVCMYNISLDGNSDQTVQLSISGGRNQPEFEIREVL